jgi:hypothetical protein
MAQLSKDLFPLNRNYASSNFYVSPALTHNFVFETTDGSYQSNDSLYTYNASAKGRLAFGFEIGLYQAFKRPNVFHYFEGGLAFREFKGEESHEGILQLASNTSRNFSSENTFTNQYLNATFRGVRADQLGKFTFLHSAIGFNANYLLSSNQERSSFYPNQFEKQDRELNVQAHLQIGIGVRLTELIVFIPNLEVPFQNFLDFEPLESRIPSFSSKHQAVLINFKFLFLRKAPENCNTPTYEGVPQ